MIYYSRERLGSREKQDMDDDNDEEGTSYFPSFRIWLCGTFRVERRVGSGYESVRTTEWGGSSYPRLFLKALLCSPGRQARRDALLDLLWPDAELEQAVQNLNTAVTRLRRVLAPSKGEASLLLTDEDSRVYRLAEQSLLWVDVDAALTLLGEAERRGRTSPEALFQLEEAESYLSKGMILQDEEGHWAAGRRATVEQARYRCRLWLAEAYAQQQMPGQAETILSRLLEEDPTDEDVLARLMLLLHRQGMTQQALRRYHAFMEIAAREELEPIESIKNLAKQLAASEKMYPSDTLTSPPTPNLLPGQRHDLSPDFSHAVTQGIIQTAYELEGSTMDQLRRQILEQALKVTSVALFTSHERVLSTELGERLTKVLTSPSHIDEKTLLYLEKRMETYWQNRNDVALPAWNLLPYVLEDLHKVTSLLEGSLQPTTRTRLCSIAGIAAMLVGELYYDMRNYAQARVFQKIAIEAAHEANNAALEAVAWGRNSFAWTYDGKPDEARESIQQAHHLVWSVNGTVRSWLAAVEAEIQSNLGEREGCLSALNEAATIEDQKHHQRDCYWIHFDQALFAGYQGASFLKLSNLGHKDLVRPAQTALEDALDVLDPAMKRRQPTLLIDLAGTYAHQENIEQACAYAIQAINIATHIHSRVLYQRLLTLRSTLDRWKETSYVQELDGSIEQLLVSGRE